MTLAVRATYDDIRSIAEGSITSSYTAIGSSLNFPTRIYKIVNNTDGDMFISTDGVNDMDFVPATSFVLYDLTTNHQVASNQFSLPQGTQFYVRYSSAPTKGSLYLIIFYALPLNPFPNTL